MTTTTTIFPKPTDAGIKAAHLLSTETILELYNAELPKTGGALSSAEIDPVVRHWILVTAQKNGWHGVEFVGDQAILKAVAPTAVQKPASTERASARGASGSNTPIYGRGETPHFQHLDELSYRQRGSHDQ